MLFSISNVFANEQLCPASCDGPPSRWRDAYLLIASDEVCGENIASPIVSVEPLVEKNASESSSLEYIQAKIKDMVKQAVDGGVEAKERFKQLTWNLACSKLNRLTVEDDNQDVDSPYATAVIVNSPEQIREILSQFANNCFRLKYLDFAGHGASGLMAYKNGNLSSENTSEILEGLECVMAEDAKIKFYGCNVGRGCVGEQFLLDSAKMLLPKGGSVEAFTWYASTPLPGVLAHHSIDLNSQILHVKKSDKNDEDGRSLPQFEKWDDKSTDLIHPGASCIDELKECNDKITSLYFTSRPYSSLKPDTKKKYKPNLNSCTSTQPIFDFSGNGVRRMITKTTIKDLQEDMKAIVGAGANSSNLVPSFSDEEMSKHADISKKLNMCNKLTGFKADYIDDLINTYCNTPFTAKQKRSRGAER